LQQAEKINCRKFVTPDDIVQGQVNLNFAFLANIYSEMQQVKRAPRVEPAAAARNAEIEGLERAIADLRKEQENLRRRIEETVRLPFSPYSIRMYGDEDVYTNEWSGV
jgi:hypothetical protein